MILHGEPRTVFEQMVFDWIELRLELERARLKDSQSIELNHLAVEVGRRLRAILTYADR
jgi:hypothetical protein